MIAPNATVSRTWFAQAWEVASDLVLLKRSDSVPCLAK